MCGIPQIQYRILQRWWNDFFFMFIVNSHKKRRTNLAEMQRSGSCSWVRLRLLCVTRTAGDLLCNLKMHLEFKFLLCGPIGGEAIHPGAEGVLAASVSKCCWKWVLAGRRDSSPLLPDGCQVVTALRETYGCLCRSCPEVPWWAFLDIDFILPALGKSR